jgi:hypothetical protein
MNRTLGTFERIAALVVWLAGFSGAASAAVRLPVPDGTYCGPGTATIAVDGATDTVTIEGYSCGVPVFAGDTLQSIQCRRDNGPPERHTFAVRVLNGALLYNNDWFRPCTPQRTIGP